MKSISELFEKTYGYKPKSDEQLDTFIDYLDQRLSFREKIYIFNTYGLDLLSSEEIEKHIIMLMNHPIIQNKINHDDSLINK